MNQTNVVISGGVVTLTSSLTNHYEGVSKPPFYVPIRYNSGTFYLAQPITISSNFPIWDVSGSFKVPTQTGTWPAFWLTGVNTWPPESDIMEFKGTNRVDQETYDGAWQTVYAAIPATSGYTGWHNYRLVATLKDSTKVDLHYYIDGVMKGEQTANTFVGSPCWLIIDYQMEGSSGAPGPDFTTYCYVSNVVVKRLDVSGVGNGLLANGDYKVLSRATGDALDVGNQYTVNDSPVDQWPYNGGLNQQWILTYLGNSQYSILGRQSGRALQVTGASTGNGARISIMDFSHSSNQQWLLASNPGGYFSVVNVSSGKTMEVADNSTNKLAPIDQWSAADTTFPLLHTTPLSKSNLLLRGLNGIPGVSYAWLTATNLETSVSDWIRTGTVVFAPSGNFICTNPIAPAVPREFFRLELPSTNGAANQEWLFQSI